MNIPVLRSDFHSAIQAMQLPLMALMLASTLQFAFGESRDAGNGFHDLGVTAPISNHRGVVATVDGAGRNVLLTWLMDHRGGYELLLIDAQTGKTEQFPIPFANVKEDSPYAALLSSANKFYTHFGDYFVEFDPAKRAYTFSSKTTPQMSMGMTEDDNGVVWSVSYPQSGLVSYNTKTREFKDYGQVYVQNWPQYQRYVAADDAGWIYFAVGETASQIVAFDPASGKATPMLKEEQRTKGTAYVYRDMDGKVYGQAHHGSDGDWFELYKGSIKNVGKQSPNHPKKIITGNQALFHSTFPDGTTVKTADLTERRLIVEDPKTSAVKEVPFDYTSEGAIIMSVAAAANGTISGGTAFPMRFFSFDPKADTLVNRAAYGQWNTVAAQGDRFFVGGYPGGFMLEWDPSKPLVSTVKDKPDCNPAFLMQASPAIHRPHCLLPLENGKTVIMGGTPEYGYTGGGLLFWDRENRTHVLLTDKDLIPDQSAMSMVPLPNGKLLVGSTTMPGTGGEKKAKEAEMCILDLASKKIDWHAVLLPGVQDYTDLYCAPNGQIYGIADTKLFFVFDPVKREVIYKHDIKPELGETVSQQGPRVLITGPNNSVYLLLEKGIAKVSPDGYKISLVAKSPAKIDAGGDYLNGYLYFGCGSHLYSYQLKQDTPKAGGN